MRISIFASCVAIVAALPKCKPAGQLPNQPLVAGHRGAPAYLPEHTLEGYDLAIKLGADLIEPDLVFTKDGQLIARHENEISGTTNVADLPQFADRKTTKVIDGSSLTGWFTEDFTLAEIQTLYARERIPAVRPNNTQYNDKFRIPTFQQVIDLALAKTKETGRVIGIYPETKHPSYFQSIGLVFDEPLVSTLKKNGLDKRTSPVLIQSFEVSNLKRISKLIDCKLVQLLGGPTDRPYDFVLEGRNSTSLDMLTPAGLAEIATYAQIISPYKELVIQRSPANELLPPFPTVALAKAQGLQVHIYTMRPENGYLPNSMKGEPKDDPRARGDLVAEITAYLDAGISGFFVDAPDYGRKAVELFLQKK